MQSLTSTRREKSSDASLRALRISMATRPTRETAVLGASTALRHALSLISHTTMSCTLGTLRSFRGSQRTLDDADKYLTFPMILNSKQGCPDAYAYAYDESSKSALWTCDAKKKADYTVTFCSFHLPRPHSMAFIKLTLYRVNRPLVYLTLCCAASLCVCFSISISVICFSTLLATPFDLNFHARSERWMSTVRRARYGGVLRGD